MKSGEYNAGAYIRPDERGICERKRKVFRGAVLMLLFGALYAVWVHFTGILIPCVFRLITGFLCPGCGVTHMIMALVRGDLRQAWRANPFLLVTGPYIIFLIVRSLRSYVRGERGGETAGKTAAVYAVCLVCFGIFRNLFIIIQ